MVFKILRSSRFVGLLGAYVIFVFSAIGFAQTVQDDFETVDPNWMWDGKGAEIAGGKLRSNYDSFSWYEIPGTPQSDPDDHFLDFHAEVTLEVNEGQFAPAYDPNDPTGVHLAIGGRGIYDPGILGGGRVIMANMVTFGSGFGGSNLDGPSLYFHELPNPVGFGPSYARQSFGASRDSAGLTRDFNGEIKMEMWVEGNDLEMKVTELSTGWEASIQHTLANVCAGCGADFDLAFPGEVGVFASNTYGSFLLQDPNPVTYQEWDNFRASEITAGVPGDHDGDGDVDGNDFLGHQIGGTVPEWEANYPVSPLLGAVAAVPEPAGCALLLAGGALLIVRAMRRGDSK